MAEVYHQRHPERSVFYRVFFHYFDRFLLEYENRFEREYGFLRPVIKGVVEKYLDWALLHESKTWAPLPLTNNSIQPHTTKACPYLASDSG